MRCEECADEGNFDQMRYYLPENNSDFCPKHKWKKRDKKP
jgi:hypothetical protein